MPNGVLYLSCVVQCAVGENEAAAGNDYEEEEKEEKKKKKLRSSVISYAVVVETGSLREGDVVSGVERRALRERSQRVRERTGEMRNNADPLA